MAAGELMTIPPENSEERAADLPQADDPPSPDGAPSLSADQIGRFLNAEEQRLALRSRELDLAEQDGKHGHEYALAALEAQKLDRTKTLEAKCVLVKWRYWLIGGIALLLALIIIFLVVYDKDAMLLELIKFVGYTALGAFGGAGYEKIKLSGLPAPGSKPDDE